MMSDIQKYIFYLDKFIFSFMISPFGDMFEKISMSVLYKYLSIFFSFNFFRLKSLLQMEFIFDIDVIKALNIYLAVTSSLIENSL